MDFLIDFMMQPVMGKSLFLWVVFLAMILFLMAMDLGLFNKKSREITVKQSLVMYGFYMSIAILFGAWVWWRFGADAGALFYTGYFIEQSLSMDNLFVISLIFMHLGIPRQYQHRVLFWGIIGVILLRGIMIAGGVVLVTKFHWILLLFGAFLVFTGVKIIFAAEDEEEISMEENKILRFLTKRIPVTMNMQGEKFFVKQPRESDGKIIRYATPLFLALCMIEISDVIFAVDSIPAIFVITTDPYIIFTSNLFAILGLRSLYFALSAVVDRFKYVEYSLGIILMMIGLKIFYNDFFSEEFGKIPPTITLTMTLSLLVGGVLFSMYKTRNAKDVSSD